MYASDQHAEEALQHWAALAMHHLVVSVSPGALPGGPAIQFSKDPEAVTVTRPAKKENEMIFAPFSSTALKEPPTGLYATIKLTVKDHHQAVQTHTFYMAEEPEQGGDNTQDPPLRPAINPYWVLQRSFA